MQSKIPLFWHNVFQYKRRTLAAISGISFAILLLFVQFTFLEAAKLTVTRMYQYLDFDLIITSAEYENLIFSGTFDTMRVAQAKSVPGISDAFILNYSAIPLWENPETEGYCTVSVLGLDQKPDFILNEEIRSHLPGLARMRSVMLDRLSWPCYGELEVGMTGEINNQEVLVGSFFDLGMGFFAEGAVLASNETFYTLTGRDTGEVTCLLITVSPHTTPAEVKQTLTETLPEDVLIFSREELIRQEQAFFLSVKPVGIMLKIGAMMAFLVGTVILYQVIYSDISRRFKEFATLKAMGFSKNHIYGVGIRQAMLYALVSFVVILPVCYGVVIISRMSSRLPIFFSLKLVVIIFVLTLAMCLFPVFTGLQHIRRADPTDIF